MENIFTKISRAHKCLLAAGEVACQEKDAEKIDELLERSIELKKRTRDLKYEIEIMEKECDQIEKDFPLKNSLILKSKCQA